MPVNKNALIRYKTIDNCLRNPFRRWTVDDLVDACSDALYEFEGIRRGVSLRTVQSDIQMMRSDKLGYNAPIVVYDHKYYRYADPDYSIMDLPLSQNDLDTMTEAVNLLRQFEDFDHFNEMADVVSRLQDNLAIAKGKRKIVDFERNSDLKGLRFLNPLYNYIDRKQTLKIKYKSFSARNSRDYTVFPHLLKEFNNIHEPREGPGAVEEQHAPEYCSDSCGLVLEHHLLVGKVGEGDRKEPGQDYSRSKGHSHLPEKDKEAHVQGCGGKSPDNEGEHFLNR